LQLNANSFPSSFALLSILKQLPIELKLDLQQNALILLRVYNNSNPLQQHLLKISPTADHERY